MTRRFRATPGGRGPQDPWFRIGSLDVNTTMLVVLLSVAAFVVFAIEPVTKPIMWSLLLDPEAVLRGQLWRVVTYPVAYPTISIWSVLTLFFFWYFGNDLETNDLGRTKMLRFLIGVTLVLGLLTVALAALLPISGLLFGLDEVQIMVLLAWIAEHPQRRFLFNVPAWGFGVVIVGIQVLQLLGYRMWFELLTLLLGIVLCALVARSVGLLSAYSWLPTAPRARRPRRGRAQQQGRSTTNGPTVVVGPWGPPPSKHQARMDALLEKIHESGTESLSDAERRELLELRDRLRGS
ncbi:DUF6576 domain-containing protein [Nocardioides sp.]|uniref:DUF6576 domain-containing protein n=1 Tax=Nocardioides sp. TaxID=35761 RepID=UPI003D13E0F0